MPLRDWILSELKSAFEHQGEDGIVVWYDAGGTLSELVDEVVLEGVRLIKFDGSFLALRFELESNSPDLTGKWLIYVPEKPLQESWLRDFELLGERLEMDLLSLLQRRCNLTVTLILTDLLRNRPENSKRLVRKWEQLMGDRMIIESEIINGLLAIAFGLNSWDIQDAVLLFLSEQNWQETWQEKLGEQGLWEIWRKRLQEHFGWTDTETPTNEKDLKVKAKASILLADLVCSDPSLARNFPFVPSDVNKCEALSQLAKRWRDSTTWQAFYRSAANEVEQQYGLREILSLNEAMVNAETFKVIDDLWVQELRRAVHPDGSNFGEKVENLERIAEARKGLFWSQYDDVLKNLWEAVGLAVKIWRKTQDAIKVSEKLQSVEEFTKRYTDDWWQLDYWALKLACVQNSLEAEDKNRFLNPAWVAYHKFLDSVNRAFMDAVKREGWKPTQRDFWQNIRLHQERVAIFIVDALRFDLAKHLQEQVKNVVKFDVSILKTALPSITEVGMAALLPDVEKLSVTWEGERLIVKVGGEVITTKNDRKKWLERFIKKNGKVIDLNELRQIDLGPLKTLVILSQELDEFGTFASDLHPRGLLEMVNRIAQAVKFVAEKGFQRIFVVADHGFLYVPEGCKVCTVSAPSNTLLTKRRFVIGSQPKGCWAVKANELELEGELLFAFPEGFSVFALSGEVGNFFHGGLSLQESIIPLLKGCVISASKVSVKMEEIPEITSRTLKVRIGAINKTIFDQPRKVKVLVNNRESKSVEVGINNPKGEISLLWLDAFEDPPEFVNVQLLDAEANQVLEEKKVPVKLVI